MSNVFKVSVVVGALVVIGVVFVFYRLYQRDVQALTDFVAVYEKYDQAVSDFSKALLAGTPAAGDFEGRSDQALAELLPTTSARISSLIKNEKGLMSSMQEIADLSGKEVSALKAYQSAAAGKNGDLNALAKTFTDLAIQRRAAYLRFRELGELKDQ